MYVMRSLETRSANKVPVMCNPSGQAWKRNLVKRKKADLPIIHKAIFQRNSPKIVFHRFQFNPWGGLIPAPNWKTMSMSLLVCFRTLCQSCDRYKHGSTEYMRATCYVINFIHMLSPKVILTLFLSFTFITVYMHFTNLHTLSLLHAQNQLFSYLQDKSWWQQNEDVITCNKTVTMRIKWEST